VTSRILGDAEPLVVTQRGAVALVTLNRLGVHNALNAAVLAALDDAVDRIVTDGQTRALVLTGAGDKAFCSGADLDELSGLSATEAHLVLSTGQRLFRKLETVPIPVIAAVNGLALGGGFEMVLASTVAVCAAHATFGLPEARLGLIPGYGGTQRLPRLIGAAAAAHVMLTGERLTAERAYALGLLCLPPVEDGHLLDTALALAQKVATSSPQAVRAILCALRANDGDVFRSGLALETALAAIAVSSADAVEGIAAFRERRDAQFVAQP
jgi:enoyl-CoA hydratase